MATKGIGYPEQAKDFYRVRQALKRLDHSDVWQREHSSRSEAALNRIEEAIAATLAAQPAAAPEPKQEEKEATPDMPKAARRRSRA